MTGLVFVDSNVLVYRADASDPVKLRDSLAPGEIPVPDWQRDLIRERLAALDRVVPEERSVPGKQSASASSPTRRDPSRLRDTGRGAGCDDPSRIGP